MTPLHYRISPFSRVLDFLGILVALRFVSSLSQSMSACSSTVRAVSRSRVPPLKTLLPFLYQTTTIQRCQPATRPIARRAIAYRPRPSDGNEIPFLDEDLPPPVDQEPTRKTTITGSERAAFQKLYKKFNTEGRQKKDKDHVVELDQIADEYYEDDEDNSKPSLDELFDEVMKGEPRLRSIRTLAQRPKAGAQPMKETATGTEAAKARVSRKKGAGFDTTQIREMRLAERERIDKLIRNATTDRDLWQVLDREVLTKIRELDLDNVNTSGTRASAAGLDSSVTTKDDAQSKPISKPDPPSPEQRILFQNYPHHLVTAVATLRSEFPSSPLPLSILPMIKSLGRSSHALGATTALYKNLIRIAWIQHGSYATIDTLLTEMDNNAIEFDPDVLALLDAIIKDNDQAKSGGLGQDIQLMHSMEMHVDEMSKIHNWRKVVMERLGLKNEESRVRSRSVRTFPQARGFRKFTLAPERNVDSRRNENQDNAFSTREGNPERKDGSREDSPLGEGAVSSNAQANKASEPIPFAEGYEAMKMDGQKNNGTTAEEFNQQRHDVENDHPPSSPAKIML